MAETFKRVASLALVAVLSAARAAWAGQTADLSDAAPFALAHGVNTLADFDAGGHAAEIVYAWRDTMNANGYGVYSVLMPRPGTKDDWTLVTFETHDAKLPGGSQLDALHDAPFDGEQVVASVRFLKGRWKGERATLAMTARRNLAKAASFIDPAPVDFAIYRLVANTAQTIGWPFYYFDLVDHFTSDKSFCNSDWALSKVLGLQLPENYQGPRTEDGCIR